MPIPVIQCDRCGATTPARFNHDTPTRPAVSEEQRAVDLVAGGWVLTPKRDLCPICAPLEAS